MKDTIGTNSEDLMLENEIEVRDLIGGGTNFTITSNFQEYDDNQELFPELLTGDEGISLDSDVILSPWDEPFAALIPLMTDIGRPEPDDESPPMPGDNVYKKIVKQPVDNVEIRGKCRVTIAYSAYMEKDNCAFDSTFLRGDPKTFVTGKKEVLPGLEFAVMSMKRGEESQFIIPYDLLFGKHGCEPRIRKKADALFVIQLIKFSESGDDEATESVQNEDKRKYSVMIDKILEVKASGCDHYRQGAYVKAAACFHRAINSLEMCQLKDETEEKDQQKYLIQLYRNAMNCYNKMDKPKQACSAFKDLSRLTDTRNDAKALFQYGKALVTLGEYKRATDALTRANKLKPNDVDITEQLKQLDIKHKCHKQTEQNMWRKVFNNEETIDPEESFEVSEGFKSTVIEIVTAFKDSPKLSKKEIPSHLSNDEMAFIRDYIKDKQMKLQISELHGMKKKCYLTKTL